MISGAVYGSHSFRRCTIEFTFFDSPKSHNLTREKSDRNTKMLSSFTSRWQMSLKAREAFRIEHRAFNNDCPYFWCTNSSAAAICRATRFECSSPMPLSETFDVRSPAKWTENDNQISIFHRKLRGLWTTMAIHIPRGAYSCKNKAGWSIYATLNRLFVHYNLPVWTHRSQMFQKLRHT